MLEIDVKGAARRAKLTLPQLAKAVCLSVSTIRDIAYRPGRATSLDTAYEIARVTGELRIIGPKGAVVMRRVDDSKERLPIRGLPAKAAVA